MSAGIIAGAASSAASSKGGQQVLGSVSKGIDSQVAATQRAQRIGFTILGIVVVGVLGFVAYRVIKKIAKDITEGSRAKGDGARAIIEGTQLIQDLAQMGIQVSRDTNYGEVANQLAQLFAGCGFNGGAVDLIKASVFNDADWSALVTAWGGEDGKRSYDACNWEFDFGDTEVSLSAAIVSELDSEEKAILNADFQQKGINVRF
jgi:hypothetical protein